MTEPLTLAELDNMDLNRRHRGGYPSVDQCNRLLKGYMDRIRRVIEWGGEPYAQPFMKLNALIKTPSVRHDWTEQKLRHVQRWTNRHLWRTVSFDDYDASVKTARPQQPLNVGIFA